MKSDIAGDAVEAEHDDAEIDLDGIDAEIKAAAAEGESAAI